MFALGVFVTLAALVAILLISSMCMLATDEESCISRHGATQLGLTFVFCLLVALAHGVAL